MENSACFIGHRTIAETKEKELIEKLNKTIENLIVCEHVSVFLFGSKSRFNDLCYKAVTASKEIHPHIKRIYIRAEFPYINEDYKNYLLQYYEDTYFPDKLLRAGMSVYVERNREMINKSTFCIIYYDPSGLPQERKSGTALAYRYAIQKKKQIIHFA